MTLTYIFHSGFMLETEQSILVFDYWMDPSGVMDGVLRNEKPLYVFSSHFHEDHFTKDIFEWKAIPLVAGNSSSGSKSDCSSLCTSLQALNPLGA